MPRKRLNKQIVSLAFPGESHLQCQTFGPACLWKRKGPDEIANFAGWDISGRARHVEGEGGATWKTQQGNEQVYRRVRSQRSGTAGGLRHV